MRLAAWLPLDPLGELTTLPGPLALLYYGSYGEVRGKEEGGKREEKGDGESHFPPLLNLRPTLLLREKTHKQACCN